MSAHIISSALTTPLGSDVDRVVDRWLAGERAARPNPLFDASTYACKVAAPILDPVPRTKHDRVLRRMGRYGHDAAMRAVAGAGEVPRGPRLGLWVGVGGLRAHWDELMPALAGQADDFANSWQLGLRHIHPFWMLRHLSNNTHALLSADLDARGEGITFGGANADAAAIGAACDALVAETIDVAVVVAYDSLIDPETIAARGAGFVPGEAAAALVLGRGGAGASIAASTGGDGSADEPSAAVRRALADRLGGGEPFDDITRVAGDLGAATAMVAAICAVRRLERDPGVDRSALCLSVGAPGLAAAVRVAL